MIKLLKENDILGNRAINKWLHQDDKVLIFSKGEYIFAFNFHPVKSFEGYFVPVDLGGTYKPVLSSDDGKYGGYSRVDTKCKYKTYKRSDNGFIGFNCYLPNRSAIVFKKVK